MTSCAAGWGGTTGFAVRSVVRVVWKVLTELGNTTTVSYETQNKTQLPRCQPLPGGGQESKSMSKLASILLRLEMNAFILGGYGHHVKTLL